MKKSILFFILFFLPNFVFATSTVVMDVDSGRILYEKNKDEVRLIASITKIMTCIVVLENTDLDDVVTVGEEVLKMYGTNVYLEVGEKLSVKDLLYGMMLRSGNDAAISLATYVSGSEEEFVKKMNEKAKEIGMKDTNFSNSHGLDEDSQNTSTSYDMALLSRYAYQNKMYREIVKTKKYQAKSSLKSYTWYNRMSLLNQYKNCIGGKNGYTPKAGKPLVSLAKLDSLTLTIVSLDDANLYEHHKNLYQEMFEKYKSYFIIDQKSFSISTPFLSKDGYVKKNFNYPLLKEEVDDIRTILEIYPIPKKKEIGRILIKLKNQEIGKIPVYEKSIKKRK